MIEGKLIDNEIVSVQIKDEARGLIKAFDDISASVYSLSNSFEEVSVLMQNDHKLLANYTADLFVLMRSLEYLQSVQSALSTAHGQIKV